jgi:hypothetical protein
MNENEENEFAFFIDVKGLRHFIMDGKEELNPAKFPKFVNKEGKLEFPDEPRKKRPGPEEQNGSSPPAS